MKRNPPKAAIYAAAMLAGFFAAQAGSAAAAPVTRTGTIRLIATVDVAASIPASAKITAVARVGIWDGPAQEERTVSRSVVLQRSGNTATATIALPYSWKLQSAQVTLQVGLNVSADTAKDESVSNSVIIALPSNGATTNVALPASI